MSRTTRATFVAGVAVAATVFGLGVLLGFDVVSSFTTALVLGVLMAALIWFAARRAETFHDPGDPGDAPSAGREDAEHDGEPPPEPPQRA